jgi:hypothetical protein
MSRGGSLDLPNDLLPEERSYLHRIEAHKRSDGWNPEKVARVAALSGLLRPLEHPRVLQLDEGSHDPYPWTRVRASFWGVATFRQAVALIEGTPFYGRKAKSGPWDEGSSGRRGEGWIELGADGNSITRAFPKGGWHIETAPHRGSGNRAGPPVRGETDEELARERFDALLNGDGKAARNAAILALAAEGFNTSAIATAAECSRRTVQRVLSSNSKSEGDNAVVILAPAAFPFFHGE